MKRIILTIVVIFVTAGCIGQNNEDGNNATIPNDNSSPDKKLSNCENGIIEREIGTNDFVSACKPNISPTIKQGIYGFTTRYSTICGGGLPPCKQVNKLVFTSEQVYISKFNFDTNKFDAIKTLEKTDANNGFFQEELPKGLYFVYGECNKNNFNDVNSWFDSYYIVINHQLEKVHPSIRDYIVSVEKNKVVEVTDGVQCTIIGQ